MNDEITNLLQETIKTITNAGKTVQDVQWVGSRNGEYALSWAEFAALAEQVNYDSGYGGQEIVDDLVVVGTDWWLERHEYDGSEWWEYKTLPVKQVSSRPFHRVRGHYSLEDVNTL